MNVRNRYTKLGAVFLLLMTSVSLGNGKDIEPATIMALESELLERLQVTVSALEPLQMPSDEACLGEVLDTTPLLKQWSELDRVTIKAELSQRKTIRLEKLAAQGQLASAHSVESAQFQLQLSNLDKRAQEESLLMEWGSLAMIDNIPAREKLRTSLLAGQSILVRLIVRGNPSVSQPSGAVLWASETSLIDSTPQHASAVFLSPRTSSLRKPEYLVVVNVSSGNWPTGLGMVGQLEFGNSTVMGYFVPSSAVVFELGKAWVYQQNKEKQFSRRSIPISKSLNEGWWTPIDTLDAKQSLIVGGAQGLLAYEKLHSSELTTHE